MAGQSALIKTFQGQNYIFDPSVSQWFPMDRKGDPKPVNKDLSDALDKQFGVQSSVNRPLPEAAQMLQAGKSKSKSRTPKEEKPKSGLAEAERTGKSSIGDITARRMAEGQGLFSSVGSEISDRMKARATRAKSLPLRALKSLPFGNVLAQGVGRKLGYNQEDISHITGISGDKSRTQTKTATPASAVVPPTASMDEPTAVPAGKVEPASVVLEKIYKLLSDKFDADKREEELEKQLQKSGGGKAAPILKKMKEEQKTEKKEGGFNLMDMLKGIVPALLSGLSGFVPAIISGVGGLLSGAGVIAKGAWNIIKAVGSKAAGLFGKGVNAVTQTFKGGAKATKDASMVAKNAGTASKVGEGVSESAKAVEEGSKLAKGASTATKVAGGASKTVKGLGKLLGFLKSVPGIGLIAGGADAIMRVNDIMGRAEAGEQMDMKKELIGALGGVLASGGLPVIGGILGSAVFPGVGTLVGSLGGMGAALLGGDKVGEWGAEKLYDYFMDDKKAADAVPVTTGSKLPGATATAMVGAGVTAAAMGASKTASATNPVPAMMTAKMNAVQDTNTAMSTPASGGSSSAPIIINKTNNIPVGGSNGGGSRSSVGVRNDDPVLIRAQYGLIRTV